MIELLKLHCGSQHQSCNKTNAKDFLVAAADSRVARVH